jgi:hypothetical protein
MGYANRFTDEPNGETKPTDHRVGMYANTRVGKIKFITSKRFGGRQNVLIEVIEKCRNRTGEVYDAPYNLWISVEEPFNVTPEMLHKHCVFGFRIYSLRNKEMSGVYNNYLTMKSFEIIEDEQVEDIAMRISDSIKPIHL